MKSVQIKLDTAEAVKKFVNITARCDFDLTLKSGKYVVDAKSILGIFSLDLRQIRRGREVHPRHLQPRS